MSIQRPLIPLCDYERIFRVVHSVSKAAGNTPGKSCIFYNVAGAYLLETNYKIRAQPVMGAAFFYLHSPSSTVLSYGIANDSEVASSGDAFHCWVQAEDYVVDFTAPVYGEALRQVGFTHKLQRKMFQRPFSKMADHPHAMSEEGDYFAYPSVELTNELMARFGTSQQAQDLVNVCAHWFKKPPKRIEEEFRTTDGKGIVEVMPLSKIRLSGAWGAQ